MLDLKPIEVDLRRDKPTRGDKLVLLHKLLADSGYKFLEAVEYVDNFDWGKYEEGS